jgi:hypothetical protein
VAYDAPLVEGDHPEARRPVPGQPAAIWAPRVSPGAIRRLYRTDALGLVDEEQIDEVGYALYARCRSIVRATAAHAGRITCPRCERVIRARDGAAVLRCRCGWGAATQEYFGSIRSAQLHGGGALPCFEAYLGAFERARGPRERMLAIDRLLHEFHGGLAKPGRPAAKNLIEAKNTSDVLALLDELAYGDGSTPGLRETRATWERTVPRAVSKRLQRDRARRAAALTDGEGPRRS